MWSRGLLDHILCCVFFINVLRGVLWGGAPPQKKVLYFYFSVHFHSLFSVQRKKTGEVTVE